MKTFTTLLHHRRDTLRGVSLPFTISCMPRLLWKPCVPRHHYICLYKPLSPLRPVIAVSTFRTTTAAMLIFHDYVDVRVNANIKETQSTVTYRHIIAGTGVGHPVSIEFQGGCKN